MTSSCASCGFLRSRPESQSWNSFNPFPIVNRVSAGVPTPPDSDKNPQLKTSKLGQNCGKTEILHLQPSYGICWSHEIETLPPMYTQDSSAFKFFSVQRLHGFRQVVTHIQSRQTVELQFTCRAVNLSKATKVLVVDQYAVQKLSQQENRQESKPKATKQKQAKNTQPQQNQNKNDTEKWDRHQQWELHAK